MAISKMGIAGFGARQARARTGTLEPEAKIFLRAMHVTDHSHWDF